MEGDDEDRGDDGESRDHHARIGIDHCEYNTGTITQLQL